MEDYIEEYINSLKLSNNTKAAYKRDLKKFLKYLSANKLQVEKVDNENINNYIKEMKKQGYKSTSATRTIATLRSFYTYLLKSGKIKRNPTIDVEIPKIEKKVPIVLTPEEIEKLLSQPETTEIKGLRDKAMLEFAYATGMRASEIVNLNIQDIDLDGSFAICDEGSGRKRIIPIGKIANESIQKYINEARKYINKNNEDALFLNLTGKRLTRQGLWKIIKTYTEDAKIDKDITPHVLRHSFALHLIENGADIKAIQTMLGHSDISSTKIYLDFAKNEIKDIYNNAHPRA